MMPVTKLIDLHLTAFAIVIIAFVYSYVLTRPYMILGDAYGWMEERLPQWLFFPLIGCEKCVAGQMALWYYIYYSFAINSYSPLQHIYFICITIFIIPFIKGLYIWNEKQNS
jgi:hypothetical protein